MAYWLSNIVIDYAKFIIVGIATFVFILIYWVDVFIDDGNFVMTLLLIFIWGLSNLTFTYLLSFAFTSPSSAQIILFLINFFFGLVMNIGSFVLRILDSTRKPHFYFFEYLLRIVPIFNFSFGLLGMAYSSINKLIFDLDEAPGPWSTYGSIKELIASILNVLVYFALIFVVEYWRSFNCSKKKAVNNNIFEEV